MKPRLREEAFLHKATRLARMLDQILWRRWRLFVRMRSDRCTRWVHHHLPLLPVLLSLRYTVAQVMMTDSIGLAIIHLMTGMHDLAHAVTVVMHLWPFDIPHLKMLGHVRAVGGHLTVGLVVHLAHLCDSVVEILMPARLRLPYKVQKVLDRLGTLGPGSRRLVRKLRVQLLPRHHVHAGLGLQGHSHWPIHRYPHTPLLEIAL